MGRAPCCDKANVKKGPWSPEEDAKLKAYIEQHGTGGNWIALPQKIGLKRCGKSCRLRWLNYLRPNIKHGGFSEEEDNIICSLYISIGSRWSIIAAQLPGRTDNDIKNYWNTRLKKKLLGRRKDSNIRRMSSVNHEHKLGGDGLLDDQSQSSEGLSASALERMQLHLQLQGLQNPFSFYNSPALWPKLQLLGERFNFMKNHIDAGNHVNGNSPVQQAQTAHQSMEHPQAQYADFQPSTPVINPTDNTQEHNYFSGELKERDLSNSMSSSTLYARYDSTIDQSVMPNIDFPVEGVMNSDLSDLIINKGSGNATGQNQNQSYELDCLKEIMESKEGYPWWANDFDHVQSSSSSWDSATLLQQQGTIQEYLMGYDL